VPVHAECLPEAFADHLNASSAPAQSPKPMVDSFMTAPVLCLPGSDCVEDGMKRSGIPPVRSKLRNEHVVANENFAIITAFVADIFQESK
jgi:hypothetical protein